MWSKGEDELSGLEYYTWTSFVEKNTDFVPIGETLTLSKSYNLS